MPVKTFRNNSPPMNFYLSSILLITNIPTIITFLIFLPLILYILPMILIVLIKASIFLLLFALISINPIFLLRMRQFLQFYSNSLFLVTSCDKSYFIFNSTYFSPYFSRHIFKPQRSSFYFSNHNNS